MERTGKAKDGGALDVCLVTPTDGCKALSPLRSAGAVQSLRMGNFRLGRGRTGRS